MNKNFHQQEFLFNNLKNSPSNKISSIPNFSFDPDLLRELNARYFYSMNAIHTINENGFSRCIHSKDHHHHLNISRSKCNKWCTAHVRISWMIYHQQQHLKEKLSLIDKKKEFLLNTKPILPFSSILPPTTFYNRSSFDVSNINKDSFGGLGLLFPSNRFSSRNQNFSSKEFDQINEKDLLLSVNNNDNHLHFYNNSTNQNCSLSLSRKVSSDNSKSSSHSLQSTTPTFHPLTLSIIERQRLSAPYASLFTSLSQENNFFPTNLDPMIFLNDNSSNLDSSLMTNPLIQHQHFIHSLCLLQQQNIQREHETIGNNNLIQIKKSLKTKFEQISSRNKEEIKRIKLENTKSNSSLSSSIK